MDSWCTGGWKTIKNVCPGYHYEEDIENGKCTKGKGQYG